MSETLTPEQLEKSASAVYLVCETIVADDLSSQLRHGAASLRRWEALKAWLDRIAADIDTPPTTDLAIAEMKAQMVRLEREP